VEDIETMRRITAIGCEQAQGYFVSKPIGAQQFRSWLANYEPVSFSSRRKHGRPFAGKQA
jgi:EAL domain-containing protein (putative c-di-GMP-specific phosphodiesterase class I)